MARTMTHPKFGSRTVGDEQVDAYTRTGWKAGAEAVPPAVDRSVDDIKKDVGDDPAKAREALTAEQSRPAPRPTLVAALTRVIESADKTEV